MPHADKPLAWLHGEMSAASVADRLRLDRDAVVICEVFSKKTQASPRRSSNPIGPPAAYDAAGGKRKA